LAKRLNLGAAGTLHERGERGDARERKKALVQAIEKPRGARDDEDEPVIAVQLAPPRSGGSFHRCAGEWGACYNRTTKKLIAPSRNAPALAHLDGCAIGARAA